MLLCFQLNIAFIVIAAIGLWADIVGCGTYYNAVNTLSLAISVLFMVLGALHWKS